jgi:hypothetical protein
MPAAQRDFVLKYYWARQGDSNSPQQWETTKDKSVRRMMRAATKRARAARGVAMVIRVEGDKEGKCDGKEGGR